MSNAMEYLTMARVMEKEWKEWRNARSAPIQTAMEEFIAEQAYKAAFTKGFWFRLTGGNDEQN